MAFTLHPILEVGQAPKAGVWYAISPEDATESPTARVGACATFIRGEGGGAVVISAGATPEGPLSDLYELRFCKGKVDTRSQGKMSCVAGQKSCKGTFSN